MHKYLYIFIKLNCYMFDLHAIWIFTYLDCLSVYNGWILFPTLKWEKCCWRWSIKNKDKNMKKKMKRKSYEVGKRK